MERVDRKNQVDWHLYAEKYDMLLRYNPFYQKLRREILSLVEDWQIDRSDIIVDVGAGTGNYSVSLAQQFPDSQVIHVDNNPAMNERALRKVMNAGVRNMDVLPRGIEHVHFEKNSIRGLISVHALYTFPNPHEALRKMYHWMKPGGRGILVDPGRIVNVISWQLAIGWHLLTRHGLSKTLQIFREAKPVSEQNQRIRCLQREGKLWTHSSGEFIRAVEEAGFQIIESRVCFRGLSDMAVVTKI